MIQGMFNKTDIFTQLAGVRSRNRTNEDILVDEAQRILRNDLFTETKILQNLRQYADTNELITEEDVNPDLLFTLKEIKIIATNYRLKFLESKYYKPEIPYDTIKAIKQFNTEFKKELKEFRILSVAEAFGEKTPEKSAALFVKTNHNNYYLLHQWGNALTKNRELGYWPLRRFENLALTVMAFTLLVTLSLPTALITLDTKATYWCGYRAGTFFHLLIFFSGFTTYFTITFAKNFSSANWNKPNDFD